MRSSAVTCVVFALLVACTRGTTPAPEPPKGAPAATAPAGVPPAAHPDGKALRHDDVAAAFAEARAGGKTVFVDAWAPWCHTCLSMQRDVLQDPSLAAWADRLVFAAVDTDRPESASFVARFPPRVWPTFFVIDPVTDEVLGLHGGSLSLPELGHFLDDALSSRTRAGDPKVKALLAGHLASNRKDHAAAARFYVEAASIEGPRQAEALLGALRSYAAAKDDAACIALGLRALRELQMSGASSDQVGYLLSCAERLPDSDPKKVEVLSAARARLQDLISVPPPGASTDDRADALALLADVAEAQKDTAAHAAAHTARLALLEADANAHADVDGARVHDYARMNSYLALGRGDDAVTLLRLRTTQLPGSYEAWARLASALHQLKRDDEARPAVLKAIELSYGPRRLRYRTLLADIEAAGPRTPQSAAAEKRAVQDLVDDADKMPPGQRDEDVVAAARQRLAALR